MQRHYSGKVKNVYTAVLQIYFEYYVPNFIGIGFAECGESMAQCMYFDMSLPSSHCVQQAFTTMLNVTLASHLHYAHFVIAATDQISLG